ncbi:hypothetical protein BGW38_000723 [Lunasporangiospora selenospora]|uniref:Septin-type G domain-containing protein n=1 Tax=Lunasporangiospora selenospora TaxID=979761 RepID=A0A9P6FUG0_9FUNG|nr:hypothetical protein BGW38_000723 [Lunasporangiospora selenospora]
MVAGHSGLGKTSFIRTLFGTLRLRSSKGSLNARSGEVTPDNRPTSPVSSAPSPASGSNHSGTPRQNGIGTKANGPKDSIGYATGPLERTRNPFEAVFEVDEGHEKINLTLVDMPGFVGTASEVDASCDDIITYLEYQFDLTLAEERKVRRNPKATDNQIHACLYFIDNATSASARPGLSDADIRVLKRLSARVNIIPVLARADTLTRAQTRRLKQAINKDAVQNQIQFFQFLSPKLAKKLLTDKNGNLTPSQLKKKRASRMGPGDDEEAAEAALEGEGEEEEEEEEEEESGDDDDDEDDWDSEIVEEKALLQSLMPFTVIAQEEDGTEIRDEETGERVQGREFPWGVLNCWDPKHCDLESLRSALLSSHRAELKELTFRYYYEKYRTEKLLARTKTQYQAQQQQQQQSVKASASSSTTAVNHLRTRDGLPGHAISGPWEE